MKHERASSAPRRRTFLNALRLLSAAVAMILLRGLVAPVQVCHALSAPAFASSSSSSAISHDSRVAALRTALRVDYHQEKIPDPPLELGIHTACKKFGRGCPDTYVAFLEDVVASLRPVVEEEEEVMKAEKSHHCATGQLPDVSQCHPPKECKGERTLDEQTFTTLAPTERRELQKTDTSSPVSPSTNQPHALHLPVQPSWSYKEYRRLTNIIVRLRVAETQLELKGIAARELQRQHHMPHADSIILRDDPTGAVSVQMSSLCASLHQQDRSMTTRANMSTEDTAAYATWCRFLAHRRHLSRGSALHSTTPAEIVFQLSPPPATPLKCRLVELHRWYAQVLMMLDPLLLILVSWTWTVALPSAVVTSLALWVCIGDGWGQEVEEIVLDVTTKREETAEAQAQGEDERGDSHDASDELELPSDDHYRVRRLAGLRFTFIECALHRSWFMSFLRLRLVLCLLVAVDFLGSFAQVLYTTLYPATAAAAAGGTTSRLVLSTSINFLLHLLPTWFRVVVNVYIISLVQGAVLIMAMKGAASAYADWQDFTMSCAAEQEYLLTAIHHEEQRAPQ